MLNNGRRVALHGDSALYRFEIPEPYNFSLSKPVTCTIGTSFRMTVIATVADQHSQFLYLLFPCNAGESIPEMHCHWDPSSDMTQLQRHWNDLTVTPFVRALLERTFPDNSVAVSKEAVFPSDFTPSQQQAVKQSLRRKLSVVIGERKRGKTGVAASLLLNGLRDGKRVLYLAGSPGSLHGCLKEIAAVNPFATEESISVLSEGLFLRPDRSEHFLPPAVALTNDHRAALTKFFSLVWSEQEYIRCRELQEGLKRKEEQIAEATAELVRARETVQRIQKASMLERMRLGKRALEEAQAAVKEKQALIERLHQHLTAMTKELHRTETSLPVPLKDQYAAARVATLALPAPDWNDIAHHAGTHQCLATTIHTALSLPADLLRSYDVVCIDDAHALNLAEFFLCASFAKERCFILADVTEQPPRSFSQLNGARTWLQRNYFHYYQHEDGDYYRFMINLLPHDVVSELTDGDAPASVFEAVLQNSLEGTPIPPGTSGRLYFLNTEDQHAVSAQFVGRKRILPYNAVNARRVVDCVKHALLNSGVAASDVLVVAPPSGQPMYLREQLRTHQLSEVEVAALGSIRLCSKRAVVFDLTAAGIDFTLRALDDRKSGLVTVADTFNTLFSTVTDDLYIVGDLAHFRAKYKERLITKVLESAWGVKEHDAVVASAARRFDDLPAEVRRMVIASDASVKSSAAYKQKLEQSRPAATGTDATVAAADRRLVNERRLAVLRVTARREMINHIAQYLGAFPLYQTTMQTIRCVEALTDEPCDNENDFKRVMEMWNLLIYETSDVQKPEHPLYPKARVDSAVPNDLQQIHTFFHPDLEQVVEEGKHQLAQSIQKIFHECIGHQPVTPADWTNAYIVFLNRMSKYLDTIINQIRA